MVYFGNLYKSTVVKPGLYVMANGHLLENYYVTPKCSYCFYLIVHLKYFCLHQFNVKIEA